MNCPPVPQHQHRRLRGYTPCCMMSSIRTRFNVQSTDIHRDEGEMERRMRKVGQAHRRSLRRRRPWHCAVSAGELGAHEPRQRGQPREERRGRGGRWVDQDGNRTGHGRI
eukprot:620395-Rhodomonas_salina.2